MKTVRDYYKKKCPFCGNEFTCQNKSQKMCSQSCVTKNRIQSKGGHVFFEDRVEVGLGKGLFALVDVADYPKISRYDWTAVKAGRSRTFYAIRNEWNKGDQKSYFMHNEIMGFKGIDHKNGEGLDNRRQNLRAATPADNARNTHSRHPSKNKYIGVSKPRGCKRWIAKIRFNGGTVSLGAFNTEIEAAKARDKKAIEFHGEFATLNFPI